jgi:hypothetical protein
MERNPKRHGGGCKVATDVVERLGVIEYEDERGLERARHASDLTIRAWRRH